MALATEARALIDDHPRLQVVVGELSVVVFRRSGWGYEEYSAWSEDLLRSGEGFVLPTRYLGEPVLRFAFVNPNCTIADVEAILATL